MSTLYVAILAGSGLLVGLLAAGVVYADAGRRGVARTGRVLVAAGLGTGSLAGFLVPYVFEGPVRTAYFHLLKSRPIAVSPVEWVAVSVATGLLLSVIGVGSYLVGVRYTVGQWTAEGV